MTTILRIKYFQYTRIHHILTRNLLLFADDTKTKMIERQSFFWGYIGYFNLSHLRGYFSPHLQHHLNCISLLAVVRFTLICLFFHLLAAGTWNFRLGS